MSAQEATSEVSSFKIDDSERYFRTVSTYDENNKIVNTSFQQKINKDLYDQRKETTPDLVKEGSNGSYYVVVSNKTTNSDGIDVFVDTIYADLDFQKKFKKRGKNSLLNELEKGQNDALKKATGITDSTFKEQQTTFKNTLKAVDGFLDGIGFKIDSKNLPLSFEGRRRLEYDNLYYPLSIASSKQDRIVFSMRYISGSRDINFDLRNGGSLGLGKRNTKDITSGSVTLPIPGGISDSNNVKYDNDSLDVLGALGFGAALNPVGALEGGANLLNQALNSDPDALRKALGSEGGSNLISALRIGLAQAAVGRKGMFSRIGGGVLNPNLELLFQAPGMRTFNFSFTMSARSRKEATQIKKIIRFFKQGMSVKRSTNNIFVLSPNTFTINYKLGNTGNDHPSIGKIKECALTDLNTTYGNGSTYMTFDDPDRTMTTYKMDMTFKELDPITEDDYGNSDDLEGAENFMLLPTIEEELGIIPDNHIGY